MAQDMQFVAPPAAAGFRDRLKCWSDPDEEMSLGTWAGLEDPGGLDASNQYNKSMSWHDFARSDGADVDSFRQFPLRSIVNTKTQDE